MKSFLQVIFDFTQLSSSNSDFLLGKQRRHDNCVVEISQWTEAQNKSLKNIFFCFENT